MNYDDRIKTILVHVGVWLCFIAYEVSIAIRLGSNAPVFDFACFYLLNICLFYFNAHVGCKLAGRKQSVFAFIAVFILELAGYDLLSICMDIFVNSIETGHLTIDIATADHVRSLWRGLFFLGLSTGYYFGLRAFENLRSKLQAEHREAVLENAHLRAQINPHLLFNVLGFIYMTVETVSPLAAQSVLLLIHSMRYAMEPSQDDGLVELSREVEQIDRMIQMNQILGNNKPAIINEIGEQCYKANVRIPPLLLMTFIENIFKHGNLIDAPAIIRINAQANNLHFHSENLSAKEWRLKGQNIGIENAKARLAKYYPNNFVLENGLNGSIYIVDLKIKL